jgi:hypothetical protein
LQLVSIVSVNHSTTSNLFNMGQSASKGLTKAAENIGKKAMDQHKPPLPTRGPLPTSAAAASSEEPAASTSPPSFQPPPPSAANPGNFLRGDGIAKEDVRDVGQEMYLQHIQKLSEKQTGGVSKATSADSEFPSNKEMPDDLLKFIQDVGPAKQTIDREFTTSRLLEKENSDELQKMESVRKPIRQRRKMPLMGQDERFTTEKNTYFTYGDEEPRSGGKTASMKDLGLENLRLYELLLQKEKNPTQSSEDIAKTFGTKMSEDAKEQQWSNEEKEQLQTLLRHSLDHLEIPTLRMDSDGNMLGLYSKEVPGPEVRSVSSIPETKVMLVLKDLAESKDGATDGGSATTRLAERRKERKSQSVS